MSTLESVEVDNRGIYCGCGCGVFFRPKSKRSHGQPVRFLPGHNGRGKRAHNRKPDGHTADGPAGYIVEKRFGHSRGGKYGFVLQHILIAESALGKSLPNRAEVHHIDGNGANNSNSNLVICENRAYHRLLHRRQRIIGIGLDPRTHWFCSHCKQAKPLSDFYMKDGCVRDGNMCRACILKTRKHEQLRRELRRQSRLGSNA